MGPKLSTTFKMQSHQCMYKGTNPAGHTIADVGQDATGLVDHLGPLPAHLWLAADQCPQVLFSLAAFQPLFPKPVPLHGTAVTQAQQLALSLVECHASGRDPSIQPIQSPLLSYLQADNTPTQFGVIYKPNDGCT